MSPEVVKESLTPKDVIEAVKDDTVDRIVVMRIDGDVPQEVEFGRIAEASMSGKTVKTDEGMVFRYRQSLRRFSALGNPKTQMIFVERSRQRQ